MGGDILGGQMEAGKRRGGRVIEYVSGPTLTFVLRLEVSIECGNQ